MSKKSKIILIVSTLVGGILSLLASSFPDGLEKVAETHGFITAAKSVFLGIMPDYVFPGIGFESLAISLAGVLGTLVTFCLIIILGKIIVRAINL
ncbi:MAG: PDGLE domain-containing protein [Patescibacteria group bacterium]|jgi:cobalt/nickel transport protein